MMRDILRWLLVGLALLARDMTSANAQESIMVDTNLPGNGQPVRLQVVIFKPSTAPPPYRLLVVKPSRVRDGAFSPGRRGCEELPPGDPALAAIAANQIH